MPLFIKILLVLINHEQPIFTVFSTGRAGLDGCCGGTITKNRSMSSTLLYLLVTYIS